MLYHIYNMWPVCVSRWFQNIPLNEPLTVALHLEFVILVLNTVLHVADRCREKQIEVISDAEVKIWFSFSRKAEEFPSVDIFTKEAYQMSCLLYRNITSIRKLCSGSAECCCLIVFLSH